MKRALAASLLLSTAGCSLIQSLDGYDAEPPLGTGAAGSGGAGAGGAGGESCSEPTQFCQPLAPPSGAVITVEPSQAAQLADLLAAASPGDTFMLRSGTYSVGALAITTPQVTVRSESGCRGDVIIDGGYTSPEVLRIAASDVTIAHLTLTHGENATILVRPEAEDITGVRLHDLHLLDPGDRAVRVLPGAELAGFADEGAATCSRLELTEAGRSHVEGVSPDCYTAGIDAFAVRGWVLADNTLEGFWCQAGVAGHAIRVAGGSRDTLVERNVIIDSCRGIGFGFKECPQTNVEVGCEDIPVDPAWRTYSDGSCPEPPPGTCCAQAAYGHCGGIIRNNFVYAYGDIWSTDAGVDTGIGVEQVLGTEVVHNTVMTGNEVTVFSSIEWRWPGTQAHVANNIVGYNLRARDGAIATVEGNLENATYGLFSDELTSGDLHLQAGQLASEQAVDLGVPLARGIAPDDIDGEPRDAMPDIGADELR